MHIAIERDDGGVSVAKPTPSLRLDGETEAEHHARYLAELEQKKSEPAVAKWFPSPGYRTATVDDAFVNDPVNRVFRQAWKLDAGSVAHVDLPAARALKLAMIRAERNARLVETDAEVLKADGGAVPGPLKAKRQALRDIPATVSPDLDAITDLAALAAYQPAWPS